MVTISLVKHKFNSKEIVQSTTQNEKINNICFCQKNSNLFLKFSPRIVDNIFGMEGMQFYSFLDKVSYFRPMFKKLW